MRAITVPVLAALALVTTLAPAAAAASPSNEAAAQEMIDKSPSDSQLQGRNDEQLAGLAVRCGAFDGLTYCLHLGWEDSVPTAEELAQRVRDSNEPVTGEGVGERSLGSTLREWAGKSYADRVAADKAELDEAKAAVGKVKYFEYAANEQPLPADFYTKYPEVKAWAEAPGAQAVNPPTAMTIHVDKTMKQPNGYYCGPTTMAIMSWNDPSGDRGHSPSVWANRLGTTTSGTSITAMVRVTNQYLTWDNRAGAYVILSIASYTNAKFKALMVRHTGHMKAPIILHPKWRANQNPFGLTTSGHFDVGAGYNYSGASDLVRIAEPAWPSKPKVFSTSTANVLAAQKSNTAFKNIGV